MLITRFSIHDSNGSVRPHPSRRLPYSWFLRLNKSQLYPITSQSPYEPHRLTWLGTRRTSWFSILASTTGLDRPSDPFLRCLNRRLRDKRFLVSVCNIRRRCLGSPRRWGDHRTHQQHLRHTIMPPIVRLAKQASMRTSLTVCGRPDVGATTLAAWRTVKVVLSYTIMQLGAWVTPELLESGTGTEADVVEDTAVDFALITHDERRTSSRRESTEANRRLEKIRAHADSDLYIP
jgi:hypothetical protein